MRALWVALLASMLACAQGQPVPARLSASDPPFVERDRTPYRPPAPARPQLETHGERALRLGVEGEEQARGVALAWLRAVVATDAQAMRLLLPDRVTLALEGASETSAELVERCMRDARSLAYEPGLELESLIDPGALSVRRADAEPFGRVLPPGLAASDLAVQLPAGTGNDVRRRVPCARRLYVRPGASPVIVGIVR